ncbi:hypothetical protein [Sphingopyxis sp. P8]|uniref:hypothetical protein n=1 Tax=Sphingopyxis sp. P8 TaxID=2763256 RepID=UPI001D0B9ED5|nr:hypothetical protein [Sphingopyxis sp. P8]
MSIESEMSDGIAKKRWFRTLGVISVIIAVPTALLSIPPIQEWFFERNPKLSVELASEIPVVNLNRGMDGLTVTLNGESLNSAKETLVATKVIFRNYGKSGIGPNDVSISDPIGFQIKGGRIVRITGFSASTNHLLKFSNPKLKNNQITISNDIIIDSDNTLTFDVLVKKPSKSVIYILPTGKISNLDRIKIIDSRSTGLTESFVERSFFGNFGIQSARTVVYSLLGLSLAAGTIQITSFISSLWRKRKRKNREAIALQFLARNTDKNKISNALAASIYHTLGRKGVKFFLNDKKDYEIIDNQKSINSRDFSILSGTSNEEPSFFDVSSYIGEGYISKYSVHNLEVTFGLSNRPSKTVQASYISSLEKMLSIAQELDPTGDFERSSRDGAKFIYQDE